MFIFQWLFLFLSDVIFVTLGPIMVALALPFAKDDFSVSDHRVIRNLPKWAYFWGNDFDGSLGDKHGWWAANTPFGWKVDSFMAQWWWLAIRNPANNMRMFSCWSAPVAGATCSFKGDAAVADSPGRGGWQFVTFSYPDKFSRYGFYFVKQLSATHAFAIRLGFKISPDLVGTDEQPKGYTFKINPAKNIG